MKLNPQQAFEQERKLVLSKTEFLWDFEPIRGILKKAMKFTSCQKTGLPFDSYKNLITFERSFFMPEISVMINILMGATPIELDMTVEENLEFVEKLCVPMVEAWRKMDDEISGPLYRKHTTLARLKTPPGKELYS